MATRSVSFRSLRSLRRCVLVGLCSAALVSAHAAPPASPLEASLDDYLRAQTQGLPGKVSYNISPLDNRTQLGECNAYEPFLPPGGKLWGKTTLGVRCLGPATWTIYVPVRVTVTGTYLVTARALLAGTPIDSSSFSTREGDLTVLPTTVLTDPTQAMGRTLRSGVAAGQPLRSDLLLTQWAVQQGQSIKMISSGDGFSVSAEGRALNNAVEGQVVQVRAASGQTVSGIARAGGFVEVTH